MKLTPYDIIKSPSYYSIPIYQRLFEWGIDNINALMEDLRKSFKNSQGKGDYFIGMLTSTKDNELVDGQQRFTVMMLMGCVLQQYDPDWKKFLYEDRPRLHFTSRPLDDAFLQTLIDGASLDKATFVNSNMKNGIDIIKSFMNNKDLLPENKKNEFASYILHHLCFFITQLPEGYNPRDLNKYFERMNTSGKNLEQHEILKVKLLRNLSRNVSQYMQLWNKLSDVDTLLIRKHHEETEENLRERKRKALSFKLHDILCSSILNGMDNIEEDKVCSIAEIPISSIPPKTEKDSTRDSHCALTFPYLLLQTLYLKIDGKIDGSISDFFKPSSLLDTFQQYLPYEGDNVNSDDILNFLELLVKCRLALDICFIRPSEYGYSLDMNLNEDDESLKKLLMLESMLYVSSSNYTHYRWFGWLMASINEHKGIPSSEELFKELKRNDDNHNLIPTYNDLSYGDIRYWFWRLDFFIWLNRKTIFANSHEALIVADNYIFRRNRSLEHIAPQTPMSDSMMKWNDTDDDKILRDSFGNLVMISQGLNSALSNESYEVKREHVQSYINGAKSGSIESLKLLVVHQKYKTWNRETIEEHGRKMYQWLKDSYK